MIILSSSNKDGAVYVETKNLDGETNLKIKSAHKDILRDFTDDKTKAELKAKIDCEEPNNSLYTFNGNVDFGIIGDGVALEPENLLLRGMSLRNTEYAYGIAVFTGHDTKIMMNS